MSIKDQITEDMKSAMRAREKERLNVIRLILAAIKRVEIDTRTTLTDEETVDILDKMVKQRRDSITQFNNGNRPDLAQKESDEIIVIQHYLPAQLSETEINQIIEETFQTLNISSIKDMGKAMAALKEKMDKRADMSLVSSKVKTKLAAL